MNRRSLFVCSRGSRRNQYVGSRNPDASESPHHPRTGCDGPSHIAHLILMLLMSSRRLWANSRPYVCGLCNT